MRGEPRGFSRIKAGFSSYDGNSESLCAASGKSNLHLSCEGELRIALESPQGK